MTPIDWKRPWVKVTKKVDKASRQSLVTPIDWKPVKPPEAEDVGLGGRQSLVTPIDWKYQCKEIFSHNCIKSPIIGDTY